MKSYLRHIFFFTMVTLSFTACQNSKYYTKMAIKQETAGLVTEAAQNYYNALLKNRSNVDAQIGMKKSGQLVLNSLLNDFAKQKNFGSEKDAVYAYLEAKAYKDKIQRLGVNLLIPDYYESDFQTSKNSYLMKLYEEGTSLLEEQKYVEAEKRFEEICKLDADYKDTKELGEIAYLQPLYVEGKKLMDNGTYRQAYNNFQKILNRNSNFRDTQQLSNECLEKGRYTIAIMNFDNATTIPGVDATMSAYALSALSSIKDPFVRVVDRSSMDAVLAEQKLQLSGVIDERTAVSVGQIVGAQALLTGTVLSYTENVGSLRTKNREAYTAYQEKYLNKEDGKYYYQTKYKPTSYTEYYNSNSVNVSIQYKLIDLVTGQIIKTEVINKEMKDEVLYGKYNGELANLFPAAQAGPNLNSNDKRALNTLFQARQALKSTSEISTNLYNTVSNQMTQSITKAVTLMVK
jgi:tetratricopeptide (TPR) repeat protein